MRLYAANCTTQNWIFFYRTDIKREGSSDARLNQFQPAKQQAIAAGKQMPVGGAILSKEQVDEIVEQLQRVGAVAEADIGGLRGTKTAFVYSVDRPVSAKSIARVMGINSGVLVQNGQEFRKKAAIASSEHITDSVQDAMARQGIQADVAEETKMSFELEQLDRPEGDHSTKMIEEGVNIDRKAPPDRSQKNQRQRRKA